MFPEVKKNFGFGCMRLPTNKLGAINNKELCKMVDAFMGAGFNYFDTARGYMLMRSERAIKRSLTSRYKREDYVLTDKLSGGFFKKQEDIRPLFAKQLKACGVEYFDFYLMHAQDAKVYEKFKACKAYETAFELKKEGKIKHVGLSFHDKSEVLEKILTEYPEIEVVQIQFNYLDYDDPSVEGKKCYDVCRKFNKPIIVMEPVKGGSLVRLPDDAKKVFDDLGGGSYASYAIRFASSFEGIFMVLSGMGNMQMMNDNLSYMKEFEPISSLEQEAIDKVKAICRKQNAIQCTGCKYCIDGCPKHIPIPDLFACLNDKRANNTFNSSYYYSIHAKRGKASDCIKCGKCEDACPQHLEIRKLLDEVKKEFGK